jgi:hypothetical protein
MFVFSNKVRYDCQNNIESIQNKEYLLWLQKMYEDCIQKETDDCKIETLLEIRDAILMKIQQLERKQKQNVLHILSISCHNCCAHV